MNPFRSLLAMVISAVTLLSGVAQAMEIRQFDKMDDRDQAAYVGLLVQGAEKILIGEGRTDLATQVDKLFLTIPAGDKMALGMTEFERNLALARVADAERAEKDPNAHRLHVEDAMLVTLNKNGITLSQDFVKGFRAININFGPKYPPQNQ